MNEDKKWKYVRALTRKAFFETQQQETQKRHQYFKGAHKIAFHEYPIRNLNQLPSGMGEGTIVMKVLKESDTNKMNSKLNVALLSRHKHKHKFPSHAVSIILALLEYENMILQRGVVTKDDIFCPWKELCSRAKHYYDMTRMQTKDGMRTTTFDPVPQFNSNIKPISWEPLHRLIGGENPYVVQIIRKTNGRGDYCDISYKSFQLTAKGRKIAERMANYKYDSQKAPTISHHGSFKNNDDGIVLFIDLREGGGERRYLTDITQKLKQRNIRFETRALPSKLNDYLFIHRSSSIEYSPSAFSSSTSSSNLSKYVDYVIPCLIERKSCNDIADSMKDKRWEKQRHNMYRTSKLWDVNAECHYLLEGAERSTSNVCRECNCKGIGGCVRQGCPTKEKVEFEIEKLKNLPNYKTHLFNDIRDTVDFLEMKFKEFQNALRHNNNNNSNNNPNWNKYEYKEFAKALGKRPKNNGLLPLPEATRIRTNTSEGNPLVQNSTNTRNNHNIKAIPPLNANTTPRIKRQRVAQCFTPRTNKLSIIPKEHTSTYALLVAIHRKELEEIGVVNDNDGEALRINKHDWMHYADSIKGSGINATRLSKKSLFEKNTSNNMFGYDGWSNVKKALVNPRSANSLAFIHRSKKKVKNQFVFEMTKDGRELAKILHCDAHYRNACDCGNRHIEAINKTSKLHFGDLSVKELKQICRSENIPTKSIPKKRSDIIQFLLNRKNKIDNTGSSSSSHRRRSSSGGVSSHKKTSTNNISCAHQRPSAGIKRKVPSSVGVGGLKIQNNTAGGSGRKKKKKRQKHDNIVKSPSYSSNYSLYKSQLNEIEKQDAILARKLQEELNGSNNITANNNDADCINLISDDESDADAEAEEEEEATYEVSSSSGDDDDDDDDDDLLLITNQPNAVDIGGSRMVKRSVSDSTVSFDFDDDDDDELFRYKAPSDFRLK